VGRYSFAEFVVSPRRRLLLRGDREIPLIPRYFDLLVFLIEHRHDAVHRREIFEGVWTDVIVSDSALSQAIRTIRRALGDDSREPRFIRTVSRHGYRFVFDPVTVLEDADDPPPQRSPASSGPVTPSAPHGDPIELLLARLVSVPSTQTEEEEQREAAEVLHSLDTSTVLAQLGTRPGHAHARALLRDTRWDVPQARSVPIAGAPAPIAVAWELVRLRVRRAARLIAVRWVGGTTGGGLAGIIAGTIGGLVLIAAPGSAAPLAVVPVLALIGGVCGAIGGAGVSAGLSTAEISARSRRGVALPCGAAIGGALVGAFVHWTGRWTLAALVGLTVPLGGTLEGLIIGGAAGVGYALSTHGAGGLAAPTGYGRFLAAGLTAACCGAGALLLAAGGRPLVGGTVHAIARAAHGSQVTMTPLARLIGEPDFGPASQAVIAVGEGSMFGFGLALGLTRRPSA
jgi:DNA-binding winged helix-turn-helix (wHTH) protein